MKPQRDLTVRVVALVLAGLVGGLGIAHADVPTDRDIAACNQAAQEGVRGSAVSVTSRDEAGAEAARNAGAELVKRPGVAAAATQSADAQLHGMEGAGAKDPAYRAAYRVCMRRNGF